MEDNTPLKVQNIEETTQNMGIEPTFIENEQNAIIDALLLSEKEMKESYESFELEKELESDRFCELLASGVAMRDAYELCHAEDIFNAKLEKEKQKWLAELKQNLARPEEAAAHSDNQGDISLSMSKKQREELIRRAERGEIIRL